MQDNQEKRSGEGETWTAYVPGQKELGENPFLKFVQRPRIMLGLLALWSLLGWLAQSLTSSSLFFDNKEREIDGALGGAAFGWEGIPLAVLYLYCARDPVRFQRVFWLALIQQAAAVASQLYHWLVTDDFTFESIIIPLAVAAGLSTLVFLHLFRPREEQGGEAARPA
jgi:hypothetical protein